MVKKADLAIKESDPIFVQANVDVSRLPMNFRAILNVLCWDNLTKKEEPLSGEAYILFKGTMYVYTLIKIL